VATARFVGIIAVFHLVGTTTTIFFTYQLGVAVFEIAGLAFMTHRLLPRAVVPGLAAGWMALRSILGFSLTVAFTGAVWVLITQTDKLVLSRVLSLADYGYFSLAAVVAGGVMVIGAPVAQAVLPRMAKLSAEGEHEAVIVLYRRATQIVCLLALPAAAMLAAFSEDVLRVWTGDATAAREAAPVLRLYAAGNGILTVAALAYYLQYARGDLRLHLIGNALMLFFYVPCLVFSAVRWGAVGAGAAWLCAIGAYFLFWVPLVHRRLEPGLHGSWILRDVLPVASVSVVAAIWAATMVSVPATRLAAVMTIIVFGLLVFALAAMASSTVRAAAVRRLESHRQAREVV